MADTVQIAGGLKAKLPRLPDRGLGYCTDTGELYVGTPQGNKLLNAPADAQAVAQLREDMESMEKALSALQGRVEALERGGATT